jgi:hypothetical protein
MQDEGSVMSAKVVLIPGRDYFREHGKALVLTDVGFLKMGQAHAAGQEVVITAEELVLFRFPAKKLPKKDDGLPPSHALFEEPESRD